MADHELLRLVGRKIDLVLETQIRHTERLGRLERDLGEIQRSLRELAEGVILLKEEIKR